MIMKRLLIVAGVVVVGGLAALLFLGPHGDSPLNGQEKKRDEFAGDRVGPGKPVSFDGERAMGYLKAICDLGPRMSGTPAMTRQQELITKHFEGLGCKVRAQKFDAKQVSQKKSVPMTNLIVSFFPERDRRVILCSHYDTRPIADQEPDERKWREPFLSANDGGSGVAMLMEMGKHMKDTPTKVGVDFVFFDGEEYVFDRGDDYFFGSKHFAMKWKTDPDRPKYLGAVLLDMIAGKGARFPAEGHSLDRSRDLCVQLWDIADELGCKAFLRERGDDVRDDHLQLQFVGIPAVDIIDFSYRHWHRLTDVPANCAPDGMEQVSRVLSVWLQRVK
jgi:hypothetical protein